MATDYFQRSQVILCLSQESLSTTYNCAVWICGTEFSCMWLLSRTVDKQEVERHPQLHANASPARFRERGAP